MRLLLMTITTLFCSILYAQTTVDISKPNLELRDDKLVITYDILNFKKSDKFRVWIEVTDSRGYLLNAKSLEGDIGNEVQGGKSKEIVWDFIADNILMDDEVFVQVFAEPFLEKAKSEDLAKPPKTISRGSAIVQSVVFPGLGLSRIKKGKPHWIKGVAGYGCISASIYLNNKATRNYDQYLNSFDIQESNTYFNDALRQDQLSEVFAYTAIGIWVMDIIWVVIETSGDKEKKEVQSKDLTFRPDFNSRFQSVGLSITYTF